MGNEANHFSVFGFSRRSTDRRAAEFRAQAPTCALVIGGMVVWGLCMLLML